MERTTLMGLVLLAGACNSSNDAHVPANGPPPIAGGTLHVTHDGRFAIAADPDRAAIHVVDLVEREARHRIQLTENDEPGRIAEDSTGLVHVVLRRAREVLTLDPATGEVVERRPVCATPRGIDAEPDGSGLVVACAEGVLAHLPLAGGGVTRTVPLDHDLRDVVARGGERYLVSRFRSAEVLIVQSGAIVNRLRPRESDDGVDAFSLGSFLGHQVPTVAWRMRAHPDGAVMVHQHSTSTQLGTLGVPSGVYYGGDCSLGVVRSSVSIFHDVSGIVESAALANASLVVDVASMGDGLTFAAASEPTSSNAFGASLNGVRGYQASEVSGQLQCAFVDDPYPEESRPVVAVAFGPDGSHVAQYRDPPMLRHHVGSVVTDIPLSGGSLHHVGHALFHEAAGTGATCASCHPEGGDDGHVWLFDVGARRTQTLTGGLLATAPFHWRGDVADVTAVLDGTFVGRMGGNQPREYEVASFAEWMDALPAVPGPTADLAAIDRGRNLFDTAGCATCHAGAQRTNNANADVGTGGLFQVPALYEVVYRAPYMHDGSRATLSDVLGTHEGGGTMSDTDRRDLETYLRSL